MKYLADYRDIDMETFVEEFSILHNFETADGIEIVSDLLSSHYLDYYRIDEQWHKCGAPIAEDVETYDSVRDAMSAAVREWCYEEVAPVFDALLEEWREAQEEEDEEE